MKTARIIGALFAAAALAAWARHIESARSALGVVYRFPKALEPAARMAAGLAESHCWGGVGLAVGGVALIVWGWRRSATLAGLGLVGFALGAASVAYGLRLRQLLARLPYRGDAPMLGSLRSELEALHTQISVAAGAVIALLVLLVGWRLLRAAPRAHRSPSLGGSALVLAIGIACLTARLHARAVDESVRWASIQLPGTQRPIARLPASEACEPLPSCTLLSVGPKVVLDDRLTRPAELARDLDATRRNLSVLQPHAAACIVLEIGPEPVVDPPSILSVVRGAGFERPYLLVARAPARREPCALPLRIVEHDGARARDLRDLARAAEAGRDLTVAPHE